MKLLLTVGALAVATSTQALAWGDEGHRIVCEIAFREAAPTTGPSPWPGRSRWSGPGGLPGAASIVDERPPTPLHPGAVRDTGYG
jgi:hypothetical protein